MKRTILIALAAVVTVGGAFAQQWGPYTPPEGGDDWAAVQIDLRATDVNPDAIGSALLACSKNGPFARVQARAENLRRDRTYSVWLVYWDAGTKAVTRSMRCSHPDASLTADRYGWMTLAGDLPECPRGKYNVFVIRWHPDGDGQNTSNMRTVLKAQIPNGG
ncbi:MAG: hypothetical protein ACQER1_10165 [Armatimonadota bacterium]